MKSAFFQQKAPRINLIGLLVSVIGIVATCLAKVSATSDFFGLIGSESIISVYGYYIAALFLATIIIFFARMDHSALIVSVINAVFILAKIVQELSTDLGADVTVSVNFFYWLALICAILDIVAVFVTPIIFGKKNS